VASVVYLRDASTYVAGSHYHNVYYGQGGCQKQRQDHFSASDLYNNDINGCWMDFSATDESGSHTHDVSIAEQGSSGDHSPPCLPPTSSFMLEITFFLISYLGAGVAW
jgi:hypothetical protein